MSIFTHLIAKQLLETSGSKSQPGADITKQPFFAADPNPGDAAVGFDTPKVNALLTTNNMQMHIPDELKMIYRILGDPTTEFYFKHWTLLSLQKVVDRYNLVKADGQSRVVDFAIKYGGMGHCVVCAYDPEDGRIFYRHDGGSNGWDREANYEFIKGYTPIADKKFSFQHWLDEIKYEYDGQAPGECLKRLPVVNPF